MSDGNHESGVGPQRVLINPVEVGVDARRPEEPQRLVDKVATDITKQPALRPRSNVAGSSVSNRESTPDVAKVLVAEDLPQRTDVSVPTPVVKTLNSTPAASAALTSSRAAALGAKGLSATT